MHVIIWEFLVKAGCDTEFERAYGPKGEWAQFCARGEGYLGTKLLRDVEQQRRYFTIDHWSSQAAFETFRQRWSEEYDEIDRRCELLTERETRLGGFAHL